MRLAAKHCGGQPKWQIGLAKLQEKTGSNAPLKKFRLNIRQIIEDDHTPFYRMELTEDDLVIFRPRSQQNELLPEIRLPGWAEDKARAIAQGEGPGLLRPSRRLVSLRAGGNGQGQSSPEPRSRLRGLLREARKPTLIE